MKTKISMKYDDSATPNFIVGDLASTPDWVLGEKGYIEGVVGVKNSVKLVVVLADRIVICKPSEVCIEN